MSGRSALASGLAAGSSQGAQRYAQPSLDWWSWAFECRCYLKFLKCARPQREQLAHLEMNKSHRSYIWQKMTLSRASLKRPSAAGSIATQTSSDLLLGTVRRVRLSALMVRYALPDSTKRDASIAVTRAGGVCGCSRRRVAR